MSADLQAWLRARDWARVQQHFAAVAPRTAEEFASRGVALIALRPGPEAARQALPDLRQALALQPGSPQFAINLLQGLIDAGELAEACERAAAMVRQAPTLLELRDKQMLALLAAARWDDALQAAITAPPAFRSRPFGAALRQELDSGWWRPLHMGGLSLRLPVTDDRDFLAGRFRDPAFMSRFHRYQAGDDAAVAQFIARGRLRPRHTRRLDWIVCRGAAPIGLTSLVDIDHENRRAELLVGFAQTPVPAGAALKAALAAMQFAFDSLGVQKLVSHVYGDNPTSQANTLHLGLRQEGLLRAHLWVGEQALDLFVNGLLVTEFRADSRLQRLLQRWTERLPRQYPAEST